MKWSQAGHSQALGQFVTSRPRMGSSVLYKTTYYHDSPEQAPESANHHILQIVKTKNSIVMVVLQVQRPTETLKLM